ncbi:hypothetical protein TURU_110740 [Turdus rufiventris]|nr:hypothetical protein TURU_110740 [Turdus rufiventris]
MITLLVLLCILPQHHGQISAEWPWSEATIRYTSALGPYPRDRCPNLATVVLHDSEVYRASDWVWDRNDWARVLNGTISEEIKVGCRKVEKASPIAIAGNLLEPDVTSNLHSNITAKLSPTTVWSCSKQTPFILCCHQHNVGNYTLDPSTNNIEITKLCRDEPTDCWYNFTLTKSTYVTWNWQNDLTDKSGLKGLTFRFKINAMVKPTLTAVITYHSVSTSLVRDEHNVFPSFVAMQGDDVAIRCKLIAGSLTESVYSYGIGPHGRILHCEIQNQECWLNLTAVQSSHKIMCGKNYTKYWAELDISVVTPTTQTPVMLSPKFSEIGSYVQ